MQPDGIDLNYLSLPVEETFFRMLRHREFDAAETAVVATALYWFAFSLPTNGMYLLLSRTFFGLQKPWIPTWIAGANLAATAVGSLLLYRPFGIAGIVAQALTAITSSATRYGFHASMKARFPLATGRTRGGPGSGTAGFHPAPWASPPRPARAAPPRRFSRAHPGCAG